MGSFRSVYAVGPGSEYYGSLGIQIYTDNTAADASPSFTGAATANPAGLVSLSSTTQTLPIAWTIKAATSTYTPTGSTTPVVVPPLSAEPNNNGVVNPTVDPNAFQWLYMVDQKTPGFINGEPFALVKNSLGIHFGQGTTLDTSDFGASNSPNFIYFEANFSSALAPLTFKTTTLRIEYFYP